MYQNKKKILVTGGAGFLGINLIRFLLEKGHNVRSLDVAVFDYPEKNDPRIEIQKGDITDRATVESGACDVDAIFHCAAALPLYSEKEIFNTDVEGTRNVLIAAKKNNIAKVVFVSSTAVYGVPDHHPLYEEDPLVGVGPYGKAKIAAEGICEEFRRDGMCVPIVRPKTFIGPERLGVFSILYEWANEGRNFPIIGNGGNRYQLLDVQDLCEAIYACYVGDCKNTNDTFNVGAKEFSTFKEDLQAVLDRAGFGKRIIGTPITPVILLLRALEKMKLSPLYTWVYETAAKDSFVSTEKIEKVLQWKPKFSNKGALVRNYEWYIENKDKIGAETGVTHRTPWKQGALALIKNFF